MVFLAPPAGFLERRACILALRFALEAGGEAALVAARGFAVAGLADTTGFFTGDLAARACFGAGLATFAWAGFPTITADLAGTGLATVAGLAGAAATAFAGAAVTGFVATGAFTGAAGWATALGAGIYAGAACSAVPTNPLSVGAGSLLS